MAEASEKYVPRLKAHYETVVRTKLQEKFGYENRLEVPTIQKIVINMGVGEAVTDSKKINNAVEDLKAISGQKPIIAHSRKAIANFKLRENLAIGCKVTLRRERMWEFFDRLLNIALPRVRDFRGMSDRSFDGRGNYSLGLKEQIVFLEVDYDKIDTVRGMDITIVTSAKTDAEARSLLEGFDFPFAR